MTDGNRPSREAGHDAHHLDRHESVIRLEERGARGVSEEFEQLHQELDARHDGSRAAHQRLEQRSREIVTALLGAYQP